ncbi:MAG: formate dehydrogenase subunit alpha [Gammaproteobacteria bacterium]|nr:formate dehydrogenase subunit alpha [Gammaproteobacteria bacterium]
MHAIDHTDFGTPAVTTSETVTLEIDGVEVSVPAGTSVMRAAAAAGIRIPRLCATDLLQAFGSCRLCLVEIEGQRGHPASCTTAVAAGMQVHTQSSALTRLRRELVELYVSEHPLDCAGCPADGHCELQDAARELGVTGSRYAATASRRAPAPRDDSNPYFRFDPALCITCSRCVRACGEIQGTFALTIAGRGLAARVVASQDEPLFASECVSCGACVESCPTAALTETTLAAQGQPDRAVTTTCGYCGVGCSLVAEVRGETIVRMVPDRDGQANSGHACIKGRFAWSWATHRDRVRRPLLRARIDEPWREVSWDEAIAHVAREFRRIQARYGRGAVGGISSSRCTNEETFLVQKLVRAGFGNNNIDTCARVCHAPTGYGLGQTLGGSAGTQTFASVAHADVILLVGANPSEAHPVFAARLKRRLREGARLIVVDPRATELLHAPHVADAIHLPLRPGTNVALLTALAHVIVTEDLVREPFVVERCATDSFERWRAFAAEPRHSPEATATLTGVPAERVRAAARLYGGATNAAIYYGLGVTEHSQGSTAVMAIANLAMATGNLGREGVGVNPLRGQNNVQGSCDMGSFPHEFSGYRHVSDPVVRASFERDWGVALDPEPGLRIPNMFAAALDGSFRGLYLQGEDLVQSDPDSTQVEAALAALDCLVVQDLFLNESARFAQVFLPGSSFLEKEGTFTNAERRIARVRRVLPPLAGYADWEITQRLANAVGLPMNYASPAEIMDEIARLTPTFAGVSYAKLDRLGSLQWPCHDGAPDGTPTMHEHAFLRGKGRFFVTEYVPTREVTDADHPLLLTTGRVLEQYNVGTQTRRTDNLRWCAADLLEIHPQDAAGRGIESGDPVRVESRSGATVLRAEVTDRVPPGTVFTSFHFPESAANRLTTGRSDWATNCPEYKVTAVQVVRDAERARA